MRTNDYLSHHGILGMKWGVRRFQNEDGSLTNAGKKRYLDGVKERFKSNFSSYNQRADAMIAETNRRTKEAEARYAKQLKIEEEKRVAESNRRNEARIAFSKTDAAKEMKRLEKFAPDSEDNDDWKEWEISTDEGRRWKKLYDGYQKFIDNYSVDEVKHSDYLAHFGILGMKWGIRRFQNEDGSLTSQGKIRYKAVKKDIINYSIKNSDTTQSIINKGKAIEELAESIHDRRYDSYLNLINDNKKFDSDAKKIFGITEKERWERLDDKYSYDEHLKLWDEFSNLLDKYTPTEIVRDEQKLSDMRKDYWKDVENYGQELSVKYKDQTVKGVPRRYSQEGSKLVKELINRKILDTWSVDNLDRFKSINDYSPICKDDLFNKYLLGEDSVWYAEKHWNE